jgi:hypothetical protein
VATRLATWSWLIFSPMPWVEPMSSSIAIATFKAVAAASRTPVTMYGAALGTTMREKTISLPKP